MDFNLDPDVIFVCGIILGIFSIPSIVSAYSDWRTPRLGGVAILLGGVLIWYAVRQDPSVYTFNAVPEIFARVVSTYLN